MVAKTSHIASHAVAGFSVSGTGIVSRRLDRIDQPARPLGAKREALQTQRQQRNGVAISLRPSQRPTHGDAPLVLISESQLVVFRLSASNAGLLIQRSQQQPGGVRLIQTMVFRSIQAFDAWCAVEPTRYDDPGLFARLCREGHGVLAIEH